MSDVYAKEKTLEREIAPALERNLPGVEVLALELVSPSRFCVYVDRPGGVDHALCERVTQLLDEYRGQYGIDVSSPGPERPLRKRSHFQQAVGRRVSVRTGAGKSAKARGEVLAARERGVTIRTATEELTIPYEEIVRGNLIDEG
jgi:ribosome maturation factor RimP